ncbi:hypothetical protein BC567DRAFT_274688 [Phyllosticta citribraziliensis]
MRLCWRQRYHVANRFSRANELRSVMYAIVNIDQQDNREGQDCLEEGERSKKGEIEDEHTERFDLTPEGRAPLTDANLADVGRHRDHIPHAIQPRAFHGFQQPNSEHATKTLESLREEHIWQPYQKDVWHSSDNTEGILSTRGRFRILQDNVPAHVLDVVDPVKIRPGHDAQFAYWGFTWTPQMMTDQIGHTLRHGRSGALCKMAFQQWLEYTSLNVDALVEPLMDVLDLD